MKKIIKMHFLSVRCTKIYRKNIKLTFSYVFKNVLPFDNRVHYKCLKAHTHKLSVKKLNVKEIYNLGLNQLGMS